MKKVLLLIAIISLTLILCSCQEEPTKTIETSGEVSGEVGVITENTSGNKEAIEPTETENNSENNELENNEENNEKEEEKLEEIKIGDKSDRNRYAEVKQNPIVTMEMNDGKVVKIELYPQIAPTTVENFISLVSSGFYDGLIFHRVIPGFMAQGGDPLGNGLGGPDYYIKGEFSDNGFENNLKHDTGVISMARAKNPDSAGSQFFIVTSDDQHASLDNLYASFGKVIEGMDEVYTIVNSPVNYSTNDLNKIYLQLMEGKELDNNQVALLEAYQAGEVFDYPINPPKIKKMTVETFGVNYYEPEKISK